MHENCYKLANYAFANGIKAKIKVPANMIQIGGLYIHSPDWYLSFTSVWRLKVRPDSITINWRTFPASAIPCTFNNYNPIACTNAGLVNSGRLFMGAKWQIGTRFYNEDFNELQPLMTPGMKANTGVVPNKLNVQLHYGYCVITTPELKLLILRDVKFMKYDNGYLQLDHSKYIVVKCGLDNYELVGENPPEMQLIQSRKHFPPLPFCLLVKEFTITTGDYVINLPSNTKYLFQFGKHLYFAATADYDITPVYAINKTTPTRTKPAARKPYTNDNTEA